MRDVEGSVKSGLWLCLGLVALAACGQGAHEQAANHDAEPHEIHRGYEWGE